MSEMNEQKRAILDVITLLQKTFDISTQDESVIAHLAELKNQQQVQSLVEREKKLQHKENEFSRDHALKLNDIQQRQADINKQKTELSQKSKEQILRADLLISKEKVVEEKLLTVKELEEKYIRSLEQIARMTQEQAIDKLCKQFEDAAILRSNTKLKEIITETNRKAKEKAREILTTTIQKESISVIDQATTVVDIKDELIKGKVIGREGRNIRSFEELTGVNLLIDDTPGCIVISCYDPLRREIAKITLDKLLEDGRIHPKRIEEVYEWSKKEIENEIFKNGQDLLIELQISNVHDELIKAIGRLKYRTSYSQNLLHHSKEVATFAANIAAELGFNQQTYLRAGLLHDIGKTLSTSMTGPHAILGAELAQKFHESKEVCTLIKEHHDDQYSLVGSSIIVAADALSAGLLGSRSDSFDIYVKRLESLENIAKSFNNIKSAFAISAGRELRVVVVPESVSDSEAELLADQIAKKVEDELTYPGQVTVTLIREKRCTKIAS